MNRLRFYLRRATRAALSGGLLCRKDLNHPPTPLVVFCKCVADCENLWLGGPFGLNLWWAKQSLHYDAVLFSFLLEGAQLVRTRSGCVDLKTNSDTFKANRHFLGNTQCAAQV